MGELIADLFVSLDGFAAGEDFGPYFDYGGPDLERWIEAHLAEPQQLVFGRRTYELLAPMSAGNDGGMTELPKLVISNTLEEPLAWENTRMLRGDGATVLAAEKQASEVPLRTVGSLSLVRSLFAAGLVDRFRLMVFPIMAGPRGGEPAFAGLPTARLLLDHSEILAGRIVSLEYRVGEEGR